MSSLSFDKFDQIGGPNITVQVDECILRRRKYQKGRKKQQIWIFGAVEMKATRGLGRALVSRLPDRSELGAFNGFKALRLSFNEFLNAILEYHFNDREDEIMSPVNEEVTEDVPIVGEIIDEDEEFNPYGITDGSEEPEFSFEN